MCVGIIYTALGVTAQSENFSPKPILFGEGTISSRDFEFNASFTPDGKTVFFSKSLLPDFRRISIVYSTFDGSSWSKVKLVAFSGQFRDADPIVTADGKKLIFISDRPSPIKTDTTAYNFWYVDKTSNGWSEPKHLSGDFYKETPSPAYPAVSANGNLYYSSSDAKDSEIYFVRYQNGQYGLPEKLSFNSQAQRDLDPAIAPDESFIIFTSPTRKGLGGHDLWVSFNDNGTWGEPINLGSGINSFSSEGQAALSPDGNKLYFTSIRNKDSKISPRKKKVSQAEFENELQSIFNGLPNIWEVDISNLSSLKPK